MVGAFGPMSLAATSNNRLFGKFLREQQSIHRDEIVDFDENTLWPLKGRLF